MFLSIFQVKFIEFQFQETYKKRETYLRPCYLLKMQEDRVAVYSIGKTMWKVSEENFPIYLVFYVHQLEFPATQFLSLNPSLPSHDTKEHTSHTYDVCYVHLLQYTRVVQHED